MSFFSVKNMLINVTYKVFPGLTSHPFENLLWRPLRNRLHGDFNSYTATEMSQILATSFDNLNRKEIAVTFSSTGPRCSSVCVQWTSTLTQYTREWVEVGLQLQSTIPHSSSGVGSRLHSSTTGNTGKNHNLNNKTAKQALKKDNFLRHIHTERIS